MRLASSSPKAKPTWFMLVAIAFLTVSCGKNGEDSEDKRSVLDEAAAAVEVPVSNANEQDGILQAFVSSASSNTQILFASANSRINGTVLAFPPTSFDIDQQVALEEGRSLASRTNLAQLLDGETIAESSGPAVSISWTYDDDTYVPYRIKMPAPEKPVDTVDPDADVPTPTVKSLIVLYIKNVPNSDDYKLGFFTPAQLSFAEGFVTFQTQSYGVYQAAWINAVPKQATEVKAVAAGQKIGKVEGQPPLAFTLTKLTEPLYGKNVLMQWDQSDLATTYELTLSAKDASCSEPYAVLPDLKGLRKTVEVQADGKNYACLKAKNSFGEVIAANSGMEFNADKSPPTAIGKPSGGGAVQTSINVTFTWNAVVDVGPSGLSHYFLQVGTTSGGSDVFNGDVVDQLSKLVLGDEGKTYYARVKAVDKVGNESEWSPVSDGTKVQP